MGMILSRLYISRSGFDKTLSGSIEFVDKENKVTLALSDEQCSKILVICADSLVEASKEVAAVLTTNIITQVKQVKG